jgi:hypothetical protein
MEKEFIPYELALELKQLGFNEPCFKYTYTGDTGNNVNIPCEVLPSKAKNYNEDGLCVSTPTFSQAFRWFREKHNLNHMLNPFTRGEVIEGDLVESMCFGYAIQDEVIGETDFKTYEEAELECLKHLIFIVKSAQGFDRIL